MSLALGLLLGLVVIGGAIALGVLIALKSSGAAPVPDAPVPAYPAIDPAKVPIKWGWARLRSVPFGAFALGYYYVDPSGGPSFRPVADLKDAPSIEEIARRAAAAQYRGESIIRLGAHEWVNGGAFPPEAGPLMIGTKLEDGGPSGSAVVTLSSAEREAFGLPAVPAWVGVYLR